MLKIRRPFPRKIRLALFRLHLILTPLETSDIRADPRRFVLCKLPRPQSLALGHQPSFPSLKRMTYE